MPVEHDIYEWAPVGFVTFRKDGTIQRINDRAAELLATQRRALVGRDFSELVEPGARERWRRHQRSVWEHPARQTCELPLLAGAASVWARLESVAVRGEVDDDFLQYTVLIDVTEQRRAEQTLRESEQRFRILVDELPLIIWVHDAQGRQQFVNRTFCEVFGVRRDDMRDDRWQTLIHPDDMPAYAQEFVDCLRDQRPFHGEIRVLRADGEWRWFESWGDPRFSASGEFLGFVGTSADVTLRKQAEDHVRQLNESLARQVAERTATLVMLNDIASMANQANDVPSTVEFVLRRVGEGQGWASGRAWLPSADDPDALVTHCEWTAARGWSTAPNNAPSAAGLRVRRGEGRVGRVFASGAAEFTPVVGQDALDDDTSDAGPAAAVAPDEKGYAAAFPILSNPKSLGVLEFFSKDPIEPAEQLLSCMANVGMLLGRVAERVNTAHILRASEEHHRAVLDTAADVIVSLARDGAIRAVNPAAQRIFGYSTSELVGENILLLVPPPQGDLPGAHLANLLQTRGQLAVGGSREQLARRRDGTLFPIRLVVNEIEHRGLFVGIIHDISEQKALERQVVDAAEKEQRRIGQDIHDGVGQELTGLRYMAQTHAEVLASQGSPEAGTAERISQWLESVKRQMRVIIRALVPVEVDQHGLVSAVHALAERISAAHGLPCTLECREPITVADTALAAHLYRIVQEAVGNAARHANARHIRIELRADDGTLSVRIADDGIGIGAAGGKQAGLGIRTMAFRAGLIGGRLTIGESESGGTVVLCVVPDFASAGNRVTS
jgi:PAS domain S-box-containing protein